MSVGKFNEILWDYYAKHGRHDLPWRQAESGGQFDPYKIVVSELMLQQTQVQRVIPKFHEFLMKFPTVQALAVAPLADVLIAWSGLGYNRRAKFLWQTAQRIVANFNGVFPTDISELVTLPGVGVNTAGAVAAYAFNKPALFVETNVRTVYIHHFFQDLPAVSDKEIITLLEQTLDQENPREFYWALMDYGTYIKQAVGNVSRYSSGYAKQSRFEGSRRQVRGQVLRALAGGGKTAAELAQQVSDERLPAILQDLVREGLVRQADNHFAL